MRKILYISGTRADYGLMKQSLLRIRRHPKLDLELVVTGMHLMPEFGKTINEIKKDKFKIHKLKAIYRYDHKKAILSFIGGFILRLTRSIQFIKPDIILLMGDRAEMLAAAIVGTYLTIPVIHIHGGDVSSTVDEIARHAITKLSHLHLVATRKSAQRVIKMGEDPWRVHIVGAPGLDGILNEKLLSKEETAKKYELDLSKPILLVLQHAVTNEARDARKQMSNTLEAVRELGFKSIVIYPNADAGGRKIIEIIERYRKYPFIQIYKSIPHKDYLSLMKVASVMVGNSSSGIIEAPTFHLPVINIGTRQEGREKGKNIIGVDYDKKQIIDAIKRCIYDKKLIKKIKKSRTPYGNGKASKRIVKVISNIKFDKRLLQKKITY